MEDTQLPTPPSEPFRALTLPGSLEDDIDNGWSANRSSSASRGSSSPPPLDDVDPLGGDDSLPPSFEHSGLDPLILPADRFDMPDPLPSPSLPSPVSPTSSLEAEMDSEPELDEEVKAEQRRTLRPQLYQAHSSNAVDADMSGLTNEKPDDEMD